jgi:NAD(P)-dependent dehydrogenase (short-subunit alcohol dehydrogenase family)
MAQQLQRFEGRKILITGGGSGIGQATVLRVLEEGGTVVAVDVSEAGLAATAGQAREAGAADRLTTVVADISNEASVKDAIGGALDTLGGLDVLVNAAGILRGAHTHEMTLELWNTVIGINLTGTFLVTRQALPALLASGHGVVVNFSSTSAGFAHPYMAAYAATKGGIQSFTHTIALEYAKAGPARRVGAAGQHPVGHDQQSRRAAGCRLEPVRQDVPGDRPGLRAGQQRCQRDRDAGVRRRRLRHRHRDQDRRRHPYVTLCNDNRADSERKPCST